MAVEFGVATTGVDDLIGRAQALEAMGYDYIGVGEHISFNLPTMNPLVALSAVAAQTSRIKLLTSVLLAPVYPPALLAKMTTTLDLISGGRLVLGIGVGGENRDEIAACGVDPSQRGARTDETLEILRLLWTKDTVDFEGRWATLNSIVISPKPIQTPYPPIWVSGRSEAAMNRAVKWGDGWLPYLFTPEKTAASYATIAAICDKLERDVTEIHRAALVFVSCHEDASVARTRAITRLSYQYNQDFTDLVNRYVALGTPSDVTLRLREYLDAGTETLIVASACPEEFAPANETLIATEVLPRLR